MQKIKKSTTKLFHDTSTIWMTKQDLNKDGINRHANVEGGNITGPYFLTKKYIQLKYLEKE